MRSDGSPLDGPYPRVHSGPGRGSPGRRGGRPGNARLLRGPGRHRRGGAGGSDRGPRGRELRPDPRAVERQRGPTGSTVDNGLNTVSFAVGLLIAVDLHEFAHAWLAVRLGDQTPRAMGRLTLNPKPLIDPFGTLVLPGILLLPLLLGGHLGPVF